MLQLTLSDAETIELKRNDLFWDGWTLVHIKPSAMAMFRADGLHRNGRWHVAKRYEVQSDGKYHVPKAFGHGL